MVFYMQNYTLKLLIVLNGPFLLFHLWGKLRFSDFLQKSFIASTTGNIGILQSETSIIDNFKRNKQFWSLLLHNTGKNEKIETMARNFVHHKCDEKYSWILYLHDNYLYLTFNGTGAGALV